MDPLDLVRLTQLKEITGGRSDVRIGIIDGPVAIDHPDLSRNNIYEINENHSGVCTISNSIACAHGTFVLGILSAKKSSSVSSICPGCTFLIRPIFAEYHAVNEQMPSATPEELASAILDCVNAGTHVINLSAALVFPSSVGNQILDEALNHALNRKVFIVAAAGNQGSIGSSVITRHPWVIPVSACDSEGKPLIYSNLGRSIGRHGLMAPGNNIHSISVNGQHSTFNGTSAATPFVTGTIALLLSEFQHVATVDVKQAIAQGSLAPRTMVTPPLLDAWGAYQNLSSNVRRRIQ